MSWLRGPGSAEVRRREQAIGFTAEAFGQAEFACITTEDTLGRFGEEELASVGNDAHAALQREPAPAK